VRRPLLPAGALVALAWAPAVLAAQGQVVLPDPSVRLTAAPPLVGGSAGFARVPRTGRTNEVVLVGIDGGGRPARVAVEQTIELLGKGDYTFSVPGPVRDVQAPAGARVQPGLLDQAIVWQGFSPGRRTLAARATLDPAAAGRYLPLAVGVRTLVDGRPLAPGERRSGLLETVVTIRNRTAARAATFAGTGSPAQLARVLDSARARLATRSRVVPALVDGQPHPTTRTVDLPLRVAGSLVLPSSATGVSAEGGTVERARVRFAGTAGALTLRVRARVTDGGAPKLVLTAVPVRDVAGLRPPSGGTWRAYVAAGHADGRRMLDTAVGTMLRLARLNQYSAFLATPGTYEQTRARYEFATVAETVAAAPASSSGDSSAAAVVTALLALAGIGAAVVLWAHL
jgi:hypothetical protein